MEAMAESASKLVDELKDDVNAWMRGKDVDVRGKYGEAIDTVGTVPLLTEVFRRFADTTLTGWLLCLAFVWKDLPFRAWKEILYRISDDDPAVYQFVWFASEYLAVNVVKIIHEDPAVSETARILARKQFAGGGPPPGSEWVREVLEEQGVNQSQLWRRLADEGAPMRLDPAEQGKSN
jgi:hypothetical protein